MTKKVLHQKEKILRLLLSHLRPEEHLFMLETLRRHPQWGSLLVKSAMAKAQALSAGDRQMYLDVIRKEQEYVEDFLKHNT